MPPVKKSDGKKSTKAVTSDYSKLKVPELKKLLDKNGVKYGKEKKKELVMMITDHFATKKSPKKTLKVAKPSKKSKSLKSSSTPRTKYSKEKSLPELKEECKKLKLAGCYGKKYDLAIKILSERERLLNAKEQKVNKKEKVVKQKEKIVDKKEKVVKQKEKKVKQKEKEIDEVVAILGEKSLLCKDREERCVSRKSFCRTDTGECVGGAFKQKGSKKDVKYKLVGSKNLIKDHISYWSSSEKAPSEKQSKLKKVSSKKSCYDKDAEDCESGSICSSVSGRCIKETQASMKDKYILTVSGRKILGKKEDLEKLQESLGGDLEKATFGKKVKLGKCTDKDNFTICKEDELCFAEDGKCKKGSWGKKEKMTKKEKELYFGKVDSAFLLDVGGRKIVVHNFEEMKRLRDVLGAKIVGIEGLEGNVNFNKYGQSDELIKMLSEYGQSGELIKMLSEDGYSISLPVEGEEFIEEEEEKEFIPEEEGEKEEEEEEEEEKEEEEEEEEEKEEEEEEEEGEKEEEEE